MTTAGKPLAVTAPGKRESESNIAGLTPRQKEKKPKTEQLGT